MTRSIWRAVRPFATAVAFAGAAGAGIVAKTAADHTRARRRARRGEDVVFGSLHADPVRVTATDGVVLHAEVDEAEPSESSGVTVVFAHGWLLDLNSWHYQRAALRGRARLVLFDQRSHGRSGRSAQQDATFAQLGRDLHSVIDQIAPEGPLVLVGHSMGGMTVMALAAELPALVASRVAGVVLIGTSAGNLVPRSTPIARVQPLLGGLTFLVDAGRRFDTYPIVRRYAVGRGAPEKYADMTDEMISRARTHVIWDFVPNFVDLDLYRALRTFPGEHTLVLQGTDDLVTPVHHAVKIADLVPGARLELFAGAGHMVMLEEHERIDELLLDLVDSVSP